MTAPRSRQSAFATSAAAAAPVTLAVRRRVTPGHEAAFAEAVAGAAAAAQAFPGYVGSEVLRPAAGGGEWEFILRFESAAALRGWEVSAASEGWRTRADRLTDAPQVVRAHGLAAWVALSGQSAAPPKWKTAVLSALGIYPMVLFVFPRLAPLTAGLPPWLGQLLTVALVMPAMTWGVMPLLTRLFQRWLYAAGPAAPPGNA